MSKDKETPQVDNVAEQIKKLGAELQAVAEDKEARDAKLKEVESFLGNLKVKDFPELADSPVVQSFVKLLGGSVDLRPGEVKNKGTLGEYEREWTWNDMNQFKAVTFIPNETVVITFNGLALQVIADQECTVPEPFYNIWKDSREAKKQARIHQRYMMGVSDVPPHPNWQTVESAEVRAWSTMGRPYGKPSGTLTVGRIYEGGEGDTGGDEGES